MKKRFALLVIGFVAVLLLAGQLARAAAGPGTNDPQDSLPVWSPDGVTVAFQRTALGRRESPAYVVSAGGKGLRAVQLGIPRGWIPGTDRILVQNDGERTTVQDVIKRRPVVELPGSDASASPDGQRIAYLRNGTLYVSAADGSGEHALAAGIS